jgi:hypothetical protein
MKPLKLILSSGKTAAFFLGNNNVVLSVDDSGHVRVCDGVHNNGGWKLDGAYTLDEVALLIEKRLETSNESA